MRKTPLDSDEPDPMRFRDFTELKQLELSLFSGFHNEVDTSLNSLLALSITPLPPTRGMVSTVRLSRCNNLLHLVLASVGIFDYGLHNESDGAVHDEYMFTSPDYSNMMDCDESPFWDADTTTSLEDSPEAARVMLVATILVNLVTPPSGQQALVTGEEGEDVDDRELAANTRHAPSMSPASLPLPAWKDNARLLAMNPSALRFVFLCAYSHHASFRQVGLQLLSSLQFPMEPLLFLPQAAELQALHQPVCRLAEFSLDLLNYCLFESEDRANLLSGLHLLANLARLPKRGNETILLTGLPPSLWPRLAELICLPDLAIVCASMEALRCLTGMGAIACNCCWQACCCRLEVTVPTQLLRPLLALVTIEGQAMGSQSLHRIKLMRRSVSFPLQLVQVPANHHPAVSGLHQPPAHHSSSHRAMPLPPPGSLGSLSRWPHGRPTLPPPAPLVSLRPAPPRSPQYSFADMPSPQPLVRAGIPALPVGSVAGGSPVRQPNNNCTSLINLLASPSGSNYNSSTPLSDGGYRQTQSVPATVIPACSSNNCNSVTCSSSSASGPLQAGCASASPARPVPSSSELTDRLQMPPPSLPPPSALRRSGKWSVCRPANGGGPTSPTNSRGKHSTASPPEALPGGVGVVVDCQSGDTALAVTPKHENDSTCPSDPKCSTSSVDSSAPPRTDSSKSANLHERLPEACAINGPVSAIKGTGTPVNGGWSSSPSSEEEEEEEEGEEYNEICGREDDEVLEKMKQDVKKVSSVDWNLHQQPVPNGLRPSILQAAIVALDNGRIHCSQSRLMNGTTEDGGDEEKKETPKENTVNVSVTMNLSPGVDKNQQVNSLKTEDVKASRSQLPNGCAVDSSDSQHSQTCEAAGRLKTDETFQPLVNGGDSMSPIAETGVVVEAGSSSSSGSSSSDSDVSPKKASPVSTRRQLFKRRRRGASRRRWIVNKRKRGQLTIVEADNKHSPNKSDQLPTGGGSVSPLKPLPLNTSESVPGSVLDPAWTPPPTLSVSPIRTGTQADAVKSPHLQHSMLEDSDELSQSSSGSSSDQSGSDLLQAGNRVSSSPKYLCEWESCCSSFDDKSQVSSHVYNSHLQQYTSNANRQFYSTESEGRPARRCCRWRGCQSVAIPRAPFALMTHVLDHHCASGELEARRRETTVGSLGAAQPPPLPTGDERQQQQTVDSSSNSVSLNDSAQARGRADQSAWSIIRQLGSLQYQAEVWLAHHHYMAVNPFGRPPQTFLPALPQNLTVPAPPREGPVTKHLRVTAALILRNLVTYLPEARRWLLSETPLLSDLVMGCTPNDSALRTNDASHIIAQCLAICTRSIRTPAPASDVCYQRSCQSFQMHPPQEHHQRPMLPPYPSCSRPPVGIWHHRNIVARAPLPPVDMDS